MATSALSTINDPITLSDMELKKIVSDGYDKMAEVYAGWSAATEVKLRYLGQLYDLVPADGRVLDLGCATGEKVTRHLVKRYRVLGVDISPHSIEIAKHNIPAAEFICADMTALDLESCSFNGIVAFFSIIHLPRDHHDSVFKSIYNWLCPGGIGILTLSSSEGNIKASFLGVPMFWSGWDRKHYLSTLNEIGFHILAAIDETDVEDGQEVTFLWVVIQRPLINCPPSTHRLSFRCWQTADLAMALQLWGNERVTELLGGPFDVAQITERLEKQLEWQSSLQVAYWPIFQKPNPNDAAAEPIFIGCSGLRPPLQTSSLPAVSPPTFPEELELGYHLLPSAWGQGFASEAAHAVVAHAFTHIQGLKRLTAGHHPENHASRRVLLKLGFKWSHDEYYPTTGKMHPSYVLEKEDYLDAQ